MLKLVRWARRVPLSPSVPAVAGRQLVRAAAYASDSGKSPNSKHWFTTSFLQTLEEGAGKGCSECGESLHWFLVGANKSYVIATSDLWLFINASNLLPSLSTPLPYKLKEQTTTKNMENVVGIRWLVTLDDGFVRPTPLIVTHEAMITQTKHFKQDYWLQDFILMSSTFRAFILISSTFRIQYI